MTLHHLVEIAVTGAVGAIKVIGLLGGEILGELIGEGIVTPFRRKKRRRVLTGPEREAEERRREFWVELLAEARARTPDRPEPDPHALKLRRSPTPPSEDWTRRRAGRGDAACPPPRRSTGG